MSVGLRVQGVHVRLGDRDVLRDFHLEAAPGACVGLLGISGAGKTTALRVIAGLTRLQSGTITIGERVVAGAGDWLPPNRRGVGMVFQDLALWPHLTARQHLALVAKATLPGRGDRMKAVDQWLARCDLTAVAGQRPNQLSGGEQRRLALARALLPRPDVLLLDEPFSGVDRALVGELQGLIADLHRDRGLTTVIVSHDWRDMEGLIDSLAVIDEGRCAIQESPDQVQAKVRGGPLEAFFR